MESVRFSIFKAENGDGMFVQNVSIYRRVCTAQKPRMTSSQSSLPWKLQISRKTLLEDRNPATADLPDISLQNRVLRRIFGPKRDEVAQWRASYFVLINRY
jgi:hypothetical protein